MRDKVAAWELDTVSQGMRRAWRNEKADPRALPFKAYLVNVVLENGDFEGLDFSEANLEKAILYDASFKGAKFINANLKDASLLEVCLDGADLSDINDQRRFEGSSWQGSNWWAAASIAPELRSYLVKHYPQSGQVGSPSHKWCTSSDGSVTRR